MSPIIRFVLKNIRENKFRTFLVVLSVALSSALFFASLAISGTVEKMFVDRMRQYFGTANIMIHAGERSRTPFLRLNKALSYGDRAEYVVGGMTGEGVFKYNRENFTFDLRGCELDDLMLFNPFVFYQEAGSVPFRGKKIVISRMTAERYGLRIGGGLDLVLNGGRHRFRIVGLAEPTGVFQEDGRTIVGVVPLDTLAALYNARGRVSLIFVRLKDPAGIPAALADLARLYPRCIVREPLTREDIERNSQGIVTTFFMMMLSVLIVSIFIIYTSFKVITAERLPVIGTFRSIGATKRTTDLVLLAEGGLYGAIGGFLGCLLGLGILYIMAVMMTPPWLPGFKAIIHFSPLQMLYAFMLAILLVFAGAVIPIVRTARIPVKDIILNRMELEVRKQPLRLPLGLAFVAITLAAPLVIPLNRALGAGIVCMILSFAGVILLVPFLGNVFGRVFEWAYGWVGNEGILAARNLRNNKTMQNNTALLAIGIASLLLINTISSSVATEVLSVYRNFNFEIWMGIGRADRRFESSLRAVRGVEDEYGLHAAHGVELAGRRDSISWVNGVGGARYFEFMGLNPPGDPREIAAALDRERSIMLTNTLRERLGVREGDSLILKTKRGDRAYQVIGFFDSIINTGSFALVSERFLKSDMALPYYSNIFVKTSGDPAAVAQAIKRKFERDRPYVTTLREMEQGEMKSNRMILMILQGFSLLALLIGIVGVLNNLIIGFIERKRALAVLRSVGMDKRQSIGMIFIESLSGGIIGGLLGILAGSLLLYTMPYILKAINLYVPLHYSAPLFLFSILGGMLIMVVASISPALKSARLDIIEAIKYE